LYCKGAGLIWRWRQRCVVRDEGRNLPLSAISSTELVRQKNSLLVMSALRHHGNLSHTEISSFTGLASGTVSAITAELEKSRLILRTEQQSAQGRGRPRVLFTPNAACAYLAVVIVSSDAIQYSLADYNGKLIDRFSEPRQETRRGDFVAAINAGLARLASRSRIVHDAIRHLSISSKGLVDPAGGRLVWSPVLGDEQVDFHDDLAEVWRDRVAVNNETLLVAEALWMRQQSKQDGVLTDGKGMLAALSLGHSIGLGIARSTASGFEVVAPNFGHMLHMPGAALCRCGSRGCIEAYCGFYAILRTAFEVPPDTIPAKFVPLAELDKIASNARHGNRMAAFAFRQAGLALGNGLARLFSLHGHMQVFVTGPGTRYYDLLQGGILEGLLQSQAVRFGGLPAIHVELNEPELVFEGHMGLALSRMDEDMVSAGMTTPPNAQAG
jgi:predicted NBD/HSP70 family sugar kinase